MSRADQPTLYRAGRGYQTVGRGSVTVLHHLQTSTSGPRPRDTMRRAGRTSVNGGPLDGISQSIVERFTMWRWGSMERLNGLAIGTFDAPIRPTGNLPRLILQVLSRNFALRRSDTRRSIVPRPHRLLPCASSLGGCSPDGLESSSNYPLYDRRLMMVLVR